MSNIELEQYCTQCQTWYSDCEEYPGGHDEYMQMKVKKATFG